MYVYELSETSLYAQVLQQDINLRLRGLLPPKGANSNRLSISTAPTAPTFVLEELTNARTLINASLDVIDVTRWAGNSGDANFIAGQLRLLYDNILEAKQTLKGEFPQKSWWENPVDEKVYYVVSTSRSLYTDTVSQDL